MRPPEVFVRELSREGGVRLKSISNKAKHQCKRQRAMIVLASSTGMLAPQIAVLVRSDASRVRKTIHAFNEQGFDALDPDTQDVALMRWSLAKLRLHLAVLGIVLGQETLRQALRSAGLSHQRTRSWKSSPDHDFQAKAERVLSLYTAMPDDASCAVPAGPRAIQRAG